MIGLCEFDPNWFEEIPGTNRPGLLCNQGIEFFSSSSPSSRSRFISVFSSPLVKKLHYRFYPIARSRGGHKFHCDHRSSQVIFLLFEASFLFRPNEIVRFVPFFAPKLSFIQTSASLTNFASFLFLFFFSIILRINWIQLRRREVEKVLWTDKGRRKDRKLWNFKEVKNLLWWVKKVRQVPSAY